MAKTKLTLGNLHKTLFADPKFMGKLDQKSKDHALTRKADLENAEKVIAEGKVKK